MAEHAQGQWPGGEEGQGAVLAAVRDMLVKLVQSSVCDATMEMIGPLALL